MKCENFYFITIGEAGYSRSWNFYKGILNLGLTAEFIKINPKKLLRALWAVKKKTSRHDVFVIMSPSHYLVPFARIFLGKNVYLDAGWSLFEGSIISRRQMGFIGTNIVKAYLIDLTASFFAKRIAQNIQIWIWTHSPPPRGDSFCLQNGKTYEINRIKITVQGF